jgi:hypothetical protein
MLQYLSFIAFLVVSWQEVGVSFSIPPILSSHQTHRLKPLFVIDDTSTAVADERILLAHANLLVDIWGAISFPASEDDEKIFKLSDYAMDRNSARGFLQHFQSCRDCAGDQAFLMAMTDEEKNDVLSLSTMHLPLLSADEEDAEGWGTDTEKVSPQTLERFILALSDYFCIYFN